MSESLNFTVKPRVKNGYKIAYTKDGEDYTVDGLRIEEEFNNENEDQELSRSLAWASCKLTIPGVVPNAWKVDTPLIQAYEIHEFLTPEECQKTIDAINRKLCQSGVTGGTPSTYRTSRTNHLEDVDLEWSKILDIKMASVLGVSPKFSEGTQGQRYDTTQYFKEHVDWFPEEYFDDEDAGMRELGNRTWSFMVYLNNVEEGGETLFRRINRKFVPRQGTALVWNNLYPDGHGNPFTIHEAMPVTKGNKWVITKWFREQENPHHWTPRTE